MSEEVKHVFWEKGPGLRAGIADFKKYVTVKSVTAGFIAAVFGCTGPALVTINAAMNAGFTQVEAVTWLFGIYFFGGCISIFMALYYKTPIVGAFTIPGASMLGVTLMGYSLNEAGGAYIISGVIVLILGVTGLVKIAMKWLPLPIVMGMIAGAMLRFGTGIVTSTAALPIICGAALVGFFIPIFLKKFPPVLGAMVFGVAALIITGGFNMADASFSYIAPQLVLPHFNPALVLSVSIPIAALVIGGDGNAQAIGVLYTQKYKVPINAMTVISGFGGIAAGLVGAHNANIAGPMTAICSSEAAGDAKEGRYTAAVMNGIFFGSFGVLASFAIAFVRVIPGQLIGVLAGLAMINVLISCFQGGFNTGKCKMGAFAALIIAASNVTILSIGSAFWALIGGVLVSLICEKKDFNDLVKGKEEK